MYKLDLNYLALAHFGIHNNPYELIINAKQNIEEWIVFINNLNDMSDEFAIESIRSWVRGNYEFLNIGKNTIDNYINNANFEMQIQGIRNYLIKKKNP